MLINVLFCLRANTFDLTLTLFDPAPPSEFCRSVYHMRVACLPYVPDVLDLNDIGKQREGKNRD